MNIEHSVIVITGASSGIGRATALDLASRGAVLALGARNLDALEEVVSDCEALGAKAVAIKTDVTREQDVQSLARNAVSRFGGIDVWINNAGVYLTARFEQSPADAFRRVMETNFFGVVHGARAAMAQFRKQKRGLLINIDSLVASAPQPFTSAYVASKYAVRGFSASLRMELALDDDHEIEVCTVMPASIDTPLFRHTANFTGRKVKPMSPINPPEAVAEAIAKLIEKPEREVLVGRGSHMLASQTSLAPGTYERLAPFFFDRNHLTDEPAERTEGNLFAPDEAHTDVSGGWRKPRSRKATRLGFALATGALGALAAYALVKRAGPA